jgi:hypothetical protein
MPYFERYVTDENLSPETCKAWILIAEKLEASSSPNPITKSVLHKNHHEHFSTKQ